MSFLKNKKTKVELLYDKYKFLLFKISKEILKDSKLAEDMVQQTFLKILENDFEINEIDSIKTRNLLIIICKNLSINIYNKMKQKEYTFDGIQNENVNDNELTEKIVISRHSVGVIINSIMKLPSIYRDILLFENVYGYTKKN